MTTHARKNCNTERPHLWTEDEVRDRFAEAARVLRGMALGLRDRPMGLVARWPDVVRQGFEAYGYGSTRVRPPAPTAQEISRADQSVLWLLWLEGAVRRVIWARASGIPWRRLEDMDGRSHTTLRRLQREGVAEVCRRLNAELSREEAIAAAFARTDARTRNRA